RRPSGCRAAEDDEGAAPDPARRDRQRPAAHRERRGLRRGPRQEEPGRAHRHGGRDPAVSYPDPDPDLTEVREALKRALALSDDDIDRMAPEAKHLLGIRRRLGNTWLDDFEVVVEVVSNEACGCGVAPGQVVVFDMRHRIKPEKSTAPLCMHMLAPVLAVFYMTFDRAAEG